MSTISGKIWFLQVFIIAVYAQHNCSEYSFPINMNGIQCKGLQKSNAHSLSQCIKTCCAQQYCETYQFCANSSCPHNTCWIGRMHNCHKSTNGWISRGRHLPSAPFTINKEFIIGPMLNALFNLFILAPWILLFYNILFHPWKSEKLSMIPMFTLLTFGLLCSITDTVRMSYIWKYNTYMLYDEYIDLKMSADFFYFCMTSSLQIFLMTRVYYVFSKSCLNLSKFTVCILIFLITIFFIAGTMSCLLGIKYNDHTPDIIANILIFTLASVDFIVTVTLIVLFAYKLKVLKNMICNVNRSRSLSGINSQITFIKRTDISLTTVIIRHSITSFFALLFDQVVYHMNWMLNYFMYHWIMHVQTLGPYYGGMIYYQIRSICILGVFMPVYMSTPYGKKCYFACCKCFHNSRKCYCCFESGDDKM
eukprot:366215_1